MSLRALGQAGRPVLRRLLASKLLRVVVTVALLAVVLSQIHLHTVVVRSEHANVADLVIATALVAAGLVIGILRWQWLLDAAEIELPLARNARIYMIATFAGTFMPTTVGTDVVRTVMVARGSVRIARVAVSVVVDRIASLLGLVILAWLSELIVSARVPDAATIFLTWATIGTLVLCVLCVVALRRGVRIPGRFVPARLKQVLLDSHGLLREYVHRPGLLASVTAASIVYQALMVLQLVFLAHALHLHLGFSTAAVAFTIVNLVILMPISIGGFGVREGTYVVMFAASAINATDASMISLLTVVTLFVASLPGAYFLARDGLSPTLKVPAGGGAPATPEATP